MTKIDLLIQPQDNLFIQPQNGRYKGFMSESRRFSKETSVYLIGEVFSKALGFLLIPLYTRYLAVDDMAFLATVMMLWPIVMILLGQGFSAYIVRQYFEYNDKKSFVTTILPFAMISAVFIALALHEAGSWLCDHIFRGMDYKPYLQYSVFFALFRLCFVLVNSVFQAKRQPRTVVELTIVIFGSQLISVVAAVFIFHTNLLGILNAQLIGYFSAFLVYVYKVWPEFGGKIHWKYTLPAMGFVLPLLPHSLSTWSISYISRIFIERSMSLEDLAVYSVAVQLTLILGIINNGLNKSWAPFVYQNFKSPDFDDLFSLSARKVIIFVMLLGTALMLFSRELLYLMGKTAYMEAEAIFPILLLSYIFQILYFIHISIIVYFNKTKLLPFISISTSSLCIGLNVILVPRWGMYGAAIVTTLSFLLMSLFSYLLALRYYKYQLFHWKLGVFFVVIVGLVYSLNLIIKDVHWIWHSLGSIFVMIVLILIVDLLKLFRLKDVISLWRAELLLRRK